MIEYIKGELTDLTPAMATVEAAGVGYGLNISLTTYSACQGKKEVKLYVYEAIREDAYVLYGFYNKKEREMFELLITVSGVGANTARMMLSGMSVSELCSAISTGMPRRFLQAAVSLLPLIMPYVMRPLLLLLCWDLPLLRRKRSWCRYCKTSPHYL